MEPPAQVTAVKKKKKKKRIMQVDEDVVLEEPDQPTNLVDNDLPVEAAQDKEFLVKSAREEAQIQQTML